MTDVEMCKRTLQWLTEHHNQANWQCGTKMCIAGAATMLKAMDEPELLEAAEGDHRKFARLWNKTVRNLTKLTFGNSRYGYYNEGTLGCQILGLNGTQANQLFRGDQTNEHTLSYLKEIINEAESSEH